MTDHELEKWGLHGGFYRNIDSTRKPWVASPLVEPKKSLPSVVNFTPLELSLPFRVLDPPTTQSAEPKPPSPRNFRFKRILRRWIFIGPRSGNIKRIERRIDANPESAKPSEARPDRVELREWKAWGYYAYPTVNYIRVRNHRYPTEEPPPPTLDINDLVSRLKSPGGTPHPELWMPGIEHPCLPPRPPRWKEPVEGAPLPFPWECQLNPFLEHLTFGPPPLCWHIGRPTSSIMFGQTRVTIPLDVPDKCQPATWPLVTHMYINAIAEDPLPIFPWPIMVYNPAGIKCEDVFETIYSNFQAHVTRDEFDSWEELRQTPAQLAYEARNGPARGDSLRRVDYLGTHHMFRGLEPHPNREGWLMFVGLA